MKGCDVGKWAYHLICLLCTRMPDQKMFRPSVKRNNNLESRLRLSSTTPAPTSFATEVHDETHPSTSTRKSHVERYDSSASSDTFFARLHLELVEQSSPQHSLRLGSSLLFPLRNRTCLSRRHSCPMAPEQSTHNDVTGASRPTRPSKTKSKNQTNATNQMKLWEPFLGTFR